MKNVVTILVVMALSAGGVYLYGKHVDRMTTLSRLSLEWPSTEGLITHSNLETRQRKVGTSRKTQHTVEIDYEYVVDGDLYRNDTAQFNQNDLSTIEKQRLIARYPVGRQVEVFYNPSDPDESVLVPGSYP